MSRHLIPAPALLALVLAAIHAVALPARAPADDIHWINSAGGAFNVGKNWQGDDVPGFGDSAVFDLPATYAVGFSTDVTNGALLVNSGDVTFNLGGRDYRLLGGGAENVFVGQSNGDNARLTLKGGDLEGNVAYIGKSAGSFGDVTVTGANSAWSYIHLYVGEFGTGKLAIDDGASVLSSAASHIGLRNSSSGEVTVTGAGSTWRTGFLAVADGGTGKLTIEDRASVASGQVQIANRNNGEVSVRDATWDAGEIIIVAGDQQSTGTITIADGASVSSFSGLIGPYSDSRGQGSVTVAGDSTWTDRNGIVLGNQSGGNDTRFSLIVRDGGDVIVTHGTVNIHRNGKLTGDGGTVTADVRNGGIIAPGDDAAGLLTIDGDLTFGSFSNPGTLEIELGGLVAGSRYDQLVVSGNATFGFFPDALLSVALIDGFELGRNQWFHVMPVGGALSGTFDGLAEGDIVGTFNGFDLFITYAADGVALYTIPEPGTATLLLLGAAGLAARRRWRRFATTG